MNSNQCQIVLVGHNSNSLILSIDKEIFQKLIFIIELEPQSGTEQALKTIDELSEYYRKKSVSFDVRKFCFHIQTKPIAELVHLIYQQYELGFHDVYVNISGGLKYMSIWFYLACSITGTRIIHANFQYNGKVEIGITHNEPLLSFPLGKLTTKQYDFLEYLFPEHIKLDDLFNSDLSFNDINPFIQRREFESIKALRSNINNIIKSDISRGSINGYIQNLNKLSALEIFPNPDNNQKKSIRISYLGIAYFLHKLYQTRKENIDL